MTDMHHLCIRMHIKTPDKMHIRTTMILDEGLVAHAHEATGIQEKTALVHAGLEALIAREAARRLASLGGSQPDLRPIPRRRAAAAK